MKTKEIGLGPLEIQFFAFTQMRGKVLVHGRAHQRPWHQQKTGMGTPEQNDTGGIDHQVNTRVYLVPSRVLSEENTG
jgi:hypothetical protein